MNERIKELMKQSGAYSYYDVNEGVDGDELPMVKFAELIVKECVNAVYDGTSDSEEYENRIKKHFGVE